ncbi:MAG: helix-turn-helix domain-containing protein [Firmicutes bacterium]|nr:helix-turn-helix domain-containing protein [Bacillota bacterium]
MSRQELRELWEQRVAEFRASGQSVATWCAARGIPPHQLHYWLRKFSDDRPVERTSSVRWLSVQVDESPIPSTDTVVLRVGNVEIEVKPGFDPLLLRQVVQVLMTTC